MQPGDIRKIRTPGSISLSPDGMSVAFTVSFIEGSVYRSEIFVVPADGSAKPVRLTDGVNDSAPRWSPDGAAIAFLRFNARGQRQLYVMPARAGAARQLTDHPLGVGSPVTARHARAAAAPVWSPSGKQIAYTARMPKSGLVPP
jgi:Tol biopolymer transport system component